MKQINNYYEVKSSISNWAPFKLINIEDESYTFLNLVYNKNYKIAPDYAREISITNIHLERIGFENSSLDKIWALPITIIYGNDLLRMGYSQYGYFIFHEDELVEIQKKFLEIYTRVQEDYNIDPESVRRNRQNIIDSLSSVVNVNQLFEKLKAYNVIVDDTDKIITG